MIALSNTSSFSFSLIVSLAKVNSLLFIAQSLLLSLFHTLYNSPSSLMQCSKDHSSQTGMRLSHPPQIYLPFWPINFLSAIAFKHINFNLLFDNDDLYKHHAFNSHSNSSPLSAYHHNILSCTRLGLSIIIVTNFDTFLLKLTLPVIA